MSVSVCLRRALAFMLFFSVVPVVRVDWEIPMPVEVVVERCAPLLSSFL